MSTALGSASAAVRAAGQETFVYRFRTWYAPLAKAVDDATGELVNKRATPDEWATRIQKAADDGPHLWQAKWWTQGSEPGWTAQWTDLGKC